MIFPKFKFTIAAAALVWASGVAAETLTNEDVVVLLEAGLGEEAVIAKIESSDGNYVTDTQTLLALRAKGVPSPVIAAMVKSANGTIKYDDASPDPKVPHSPGFYMLDDTAGQPFMSSLTLPERTSRRFFLRAMAMRLFPERVIAH